MLDVSSNDESTTCQLLGRETPDAVGMSSQIHIISLLSLLFLVSNPLTTAQSVPNLSSPVTVTSGTTLPPATILPSGSSVMHAIAKAMSGDMDSG